MENLSEFNSLIESGENIVFFGGAGVSTESGIPDFRSRDGLYNQKYDYPPEVILSHSFFVKKTSEFYRFYRDKMLCTNAKPNDAHIALAKLEKMNKLKAVITQNIDGLHYAAGSENVLELHGSIHRNFCMKCGKKYGLEAIGASEAVPHCECGGIIKPDVVLYEEPLDADLTDRALEYVRTADVLIIGGTSLSVYPAASLVNYYRGNKLILINKTPTPMDKNADLLIKGSIGKVFANLVL